MNLHSTPRQQLESLWRLYQSPDFSTLVALLKDDLAKTTQEAISTADPRICGAAQALQGVLNLLDSIPAAALALKDSE